MDYHWNLCWLWCYLICIHCAYVHIFCSLLPTISFAICQTPIPTRAHFSFTSYLPSCSLAFDHSTLSIIVSVPLHLHHFLLSTPPLSDLSSLLSIYIFQPPICRSFIPPSSSHSSLFFLNWSLLVLLSLRHISTINPFVSFDSTSARSLTPSSSLLFRLILNISFKKESAAEFSVSLAIIDPELLPLCGCFPHRSVNETFLLSDCGR